MRREWQAKERAVQKASQRNGQGKDGEKGAAGQGKAAYVQGKGRTCLVRELCGLLHAEDPPAQLQVLGLESSDLDLAPKR